MTVLYPVILAVMKRVTAISSLLSITVGFGLCGEAVAEDSQELAKKLNNPVASLISVPFQYNYDHDIGPADEGHKHQLNIQPVVPFSLGPEWNVVSRTIMPIIDQDDIFPLSGEQFGLGDITQSLFFTPKDTQGGIVWALGPVFLLPTGTDELLGTEKWSAGPTALLLAQQQGWTVGVLANHLWSFAGEEDRNDVNATFLQPFVSYTTPDAWTFGVNTESTYDWTAEQWSVPINLTVTKLTMLGSQPVSLGGGVRYWADGPDTGPEGWGARAIVTFLFPGGG